MDPVTIIGPDRPIFATHSSILLLPSTCPSMGAQRVRDVIIRTNMRGGVAALLDKLAIPQVVIVGHSMGGSASAAASNGT